jgi:hypothetical protein
VPELARSAHAQAAPDCPEGSTAPECVAGAVSGEAGEGG